HPRSGGRRSGAGPAPPHPSMIPTPSRVFMHSARLPLLLAASAAAALAARPAGAQRAAPSDSAGRDTASLRPVVVTATRVAVPQAAPTATATVITGEQ